MMPGPKEWFFIFLVVLLIFGAKRIPEIMRAMGRGLGEFRKARDDFEDALRDSNRTEGQRSATDENGDSKPAAETQAQPDDAESTGSQENERSAADNPERAA